MDSGDLTTAELDKLYMQLNYLRRLKRRMEDLRFPRDDALYLAVSAAWEAVWRHRQEAHGYRAEWGRDTQRPRSMTRLCLQKMTPTGLEPVLPA
jgi:hypothetical protein